MTDYKPGTYVKGAIVRIANTKADAVSLAFDGFKFSEDSEQEPTEAPGAEPTPDFPEPESLLDGDSEDPADDLTYDDDFFVDDDN